MERGFAVALLQRLWTPVVARCLVGYCVILMVLVSGVGWLCVFRALLPLGCSDGRIEWVNCDMISSLSTRSLS